MDGTITDTENIWHKTDLMLLEKRGITCTSEIDQKIQRKTHGLHHIDRCALLIKDFGLSDTLEALSQEKVDLAHHLYKTELIFIKGFPEFFKRIQQYKIKTAIATNASNKVIDIASNSLKLRDLFGEHIYGKRSVEAKA